MKEIQLTRGKVAYVDDEDFEKVSRFKWYAQKVEQGNKIRFYAARRISFDSKSKIQLMHRFILGESIPEGDHIDGDGLNNQRFNLRPCTHRQNHMNLNPDRAGRTSRFKGVSWNKLRHKWQAYICPDGKKIHLGTFEKEEDGAVAYDRAAQNHYGEFASLNFG